MPGAGGIDVPQIIPLRTSRGLKKHVIDSRTKIVIRTKYHVIENEDCVIYFTLNGKRPNPFQLYGDKYTYKFEEPFMLSPGKVTIKALAVKEEDELKQSSVITRTFTVHERESNGSSDDETVDQEVSSNVEFTNLSLSQQFRHKLITSSRESIISGLSNRSPSPAAVTSPQVSPHKSHISHVAPVTKLSSSLCIYCSAPRGLTQTYCTSCGSKLPQLPTTDGEPTRLSSCPNCRSEFLLDTDICHICDSTLHKPPLLPSLNTSGNEGMITCLNCGMLNDQNMIMCTTCDQHLLKKRDQKGVLEPKGGARETIMHPIIGSSYMMCGTCGRVNVSDARYCDWCGCKPAGCEVDIICQSCGSTNDWQCRFCSSCGEIIKCPMRPEVENGSTLKIPKGVTIDHHKWVPVADIVINKEDKSVTAEPQTHSKETQTCGLFYPSDRTITVNKQKETWQKLVKKTTQDRVLKLSTYSPGKGLWRNQLEHITNHIKGHCSSSHEFQESIAHYQLGKLTNALIDKDDTSNEVNIKLVFDLKSDLNDSLTSYSSLTKLKSSTNDKVIFYLHSTAKRNSISRSSSDMETLRRSSSYLTLKVEDHLLASELGSKGQGSPDTVTSLVDKGAKVDSIDTSSGLPMICLAAANGHLEAMNILIDNNADINVQVKRTGNTALHEAVTRGLKPIIQSLLSCGADPAIKNKDNLTPCKLADKLGHKELTMLFANQLSSNILTKLHPQTKQ